MRWLGRLVGGLALFAWAALFGFVSLFASAWRCDESCRAPGSGRWWEHDDAWQWSALGWLGVVGALLAVAATVGGVRLIDNQLLGTTRRTTS